MLTHRVLSGSIIYNEISPHLYITSPSRFNRYYSNIIYDEVLYNCKCNEIWEENDLIYFLVEQSLWDVDKQKRFEYLPKEIEESKVSLYECYFRSLDKQRYREKIKQLKEEYDQLHILRYKYYYLTCEGVAAIAKQRYLAGSSVKNKLFKKGWWNRPNNLIDLVLGFINKNKISDGQFRELARTDPWRSYWNARKGGFKLFKEPISDDQLSLLTWTTVYDNIYESGERPSREIIEDDDALDGWMIIQKRKQGESDTKKEVDQLITNPKIKNSQEIFIVAQTPEDARKIDSLNDIGAAVIKAQKMAILKQKGTVHEMEMPDVQQRAQMEFNKGMVERTKRR